MAEHNPTPTIRVHFSGSLNNTPVQSVRGEIARSGEAPYLLLGLTGGWLLDVEALSLRDTRHRLLLISPDDRSFSGVTSGQIRVQDAQATLPLSPTLLQALDAPEALLLCGEVSWPLGAAEPPPAWRGTAQLRWLGQVYGPLQTTLRAFNDGWRITRVIPLAPGHTLSITIHLDTLETPTTGTIHVFEALPDHARVAGVHAPLLRVVRQGGALVVRVTALVDDADDVPQAFAFQFHAPGSLL